MGFDYRTSTLLGKQILGEHKQNLVFTRIQEKGAVTPQEIESDFPVCPEVFSRDMGQKWPAEVLLKIITAITPTIVWPQAKQQEGNIATIQ